MWLWLSTIPGMMILPDASMLWAPDGMVTAPTARIFPFWTSNVPLGISGPEIGMIRAPMKAIGFVWALAAREITTSTEAFQELTTGLSHTY
jgi:hypothetical protein